MAGTESKTVWIVRTSHPIERDVLIGVFSTEEKAKAVVADYIAHAYERSSGRRHFTYEGEDQWSCPSDCGDCYIEYDEEVMDP